MSRSNGKKSNTRILLSKGFRKKGLKILSSQLETYRKGDVVDIKIDPSTHKGQPFKFYHGKTGKILSVLRRSAIIEIEKVIRQRRIRKRITVRFEHLTKNNAGSSQKESVKLKDNVRHKIISFGRRSIIFNKSSETSFSNKFVSYDQVEFVNAEPYSVLI